MLINKPKTLSHCQQIQILETLCKGFFSSKFDKIIGLNEEVAKMSAKAFFEEVIQPRIKLLEETGIRMEKGLALRKEMMIEADIEIEYKNLKKNN